MGATIMVVDDEVGARKLITIMLKRAGHEVVEAKDAQEALTLLDSSRPDLIILDVMMPRMNGIELCGVLRERDDTQTTPILILSARQDPETVLSGMEAGANDYLVKPIMHHDLVTKVKDMLPG